MSDEKYSGVVILNKSAGITSHDAVNRIRKIFKTKKVGHTGTLDPMATGVLPILVGHAVKASSFLVTDTKGYRARFVLGVKTDTEDTSGKVLEERDVRVSDEDVYKAVSSFKGESKQTPPMYSALKVNGQKLYELARQGIVVEREARDIYIDRIEIVKKTSEREWEIEVECSKGTYIRTLVSDIGEKLGCGASMSALTRTRSGSFDIQNSYTLDELEELSKAERLESVLIPTEMLFEELQEISLPSFYSRLAKNGQPIYSSRAKLSLPETATRVRLSDERGVFFALGEVTELDGEKCVKAIKMFC